MTMTQLSLEEEAAKLRNDARATSRLAALKASPRSGTIRRRVLELVARNDGLTDDDISQRLNISPNTIRPRRLELVEGGWVTEGGEGVSRYGNPAILWVPTEKAVKWWTQ